MINAFLIALGATLGVAVGLGLIFAGLTLLVACFNLILYGRPR